ncbi:DUF309 domain-containing protein [Ruegeria sp.]|uniref:DUF309 domain-containing protein n=1 Tax=Ruegeria sp. TaxID=1879320 RepID=UPI002320D7C8|nr:DUF309 domain-containing protein [Ruegeria sp.]MDA7965064.1 DUF309 domain-containing protein [Ruegeria sp.]
MTVSWKPAQPYIPGRTLRPAEGAFDDLKCGLNDIPVERLTETRAWVAGLAFFRDGYYWEAHEVLETVWLACPPNAPERLMVQAIIQRANAELKRVMGQERAALRLFDLSDKLACEAVERAGRSVLGFNAELRIKVHD